MRLGGISGMELNIGIEHVIGAEYIFLPLRIHRQHIARCQR